ncbi:MAG: oligosaccharide flippase family protein [Bacteroidales bacterium]|nr:oligosaccharide flippase family protein [Bacteroidales bacterium]
MTTAANTSRIAKNTLLLYFRQILIMLVSLYTVRVVLNVLGAEDYGIYNVVAGVVTMFGFLSSAMATASQRYFAFDLGKQDYEHLKTTFSVTFQIYVLLSAIIVVLAETIGLWFVMNKLVIPPERMTAAIWIYQAAVMSFLLTLITTPYMASIIAHENMNIYAYVSIIEAVLKLVIVFLLQILSFDKLVLYGLLLMAVSLINTTIYRVYCKKHYSECKFKFVKDKALFRELVSYSGWNLFGAAVGTAKNQLVNISINLFCGPIVNAARGVAMSICNAANSFASNFSVALNPNIIKLYAADEKEKYLDFTFRGMRMVFLLLLFLACPLIFEMDGIIKLWLENPPEHTVIFTKLALIDVIICSISYTLGAAIQATGKIKTYQIVVGTLLLLNFPLSYVALENGLSPLWTFYIAIVISVLSLILRLLFMRGIVGFSLTDKIFMKNFMKIIICSAIIATLCITFKYFVNDWHFIVNLIVEYIICSIVIMVVGLSKDEYMPLLKKVLKK